MISVIAQGLPRVFSQLIENGLNSAFAKAYEKHLEILPIIDLIFEEGNPAGIKSLLNHQGICEPYVRLPLVPASETLHKRIGDFLSDFKE